MAFDVNAFIGDILKDVQVDDATKGALTATFTNPTVAKRLEEGQLRQSDFSRIAGEYQAKIKAAQEYWDGLKKWKEQEDARLQSDRQLIEKKLADGGIGLHDLEAAKKLENVVGKDELAKLANDSVAYSNLMVTLGLRHLKEFGEVLDPNDLLTVVNRDGVPINVAYDRFIQPKREEVQKADIQKQLAQAREEGKAEALKNLNLPDAGVSFSDSTPSAFDYLNRKADAAPAYGAMAAVKAFAAQQKSGSTL